MADNIYLNLPIFCNVHTDGVGKTCMQLHLLEKQNDLLVCSNLPYFSFLSPGPLKGHYPQVGYQDPPGLVCVTKSYFHPRGITTCARNKFYISPGRFWASLSAFLGATPYFHFFSTLRLNPIFTQSLTLKLIS